MLSGSLIPRPYLRRMSDCPDSAPPTPRSPHGPSSRQSVDLVQHHLEQKGITMEQQRPITSGILESLQSSPECEFESLVTGLPQFTWNELFSEVSRLSRGGHINITRGVGIFTIRLATASR